MKFNTTTAKFGAGSLAAIALTFGTVGIAGAQTDADEAEADTSEEATTEQENSRSGRKTARRMAIAEVLDITVDELSEQRQAGSTLAEIAGDQVDEVVELLVDQAEERIAERVEEGRITQDEADERLAAVEERITDRVENGNTGDRDGRRGNRGHGNDRGERGDVTETETVDS